MWNDRRILDLFEIEHPILLAPMAGSSPAALVAAVSEAGGMGGYGAAAATPLGLRTAMRDIRALTSKPFNVNFFEARTLANEDPPPAGPGLTALLARHHAELGLGPIPELVRLFEDTEPLLETALDEGVAVVSFHFGVDAATVARAHAAGAKVISSATTLEEAKQLEAAGVDAVIAQGAEAGGHRGSFDEGARGALIGTLALVPRIVDGTALPVIAAGGVMDARGLVACLALGASAVQMGTAFLGCPEAAVSDVWREALATAEGEDTTVTMAHSGKPARAIRSRYIEEVEALDEPLLPFPAQMAIGRELRRAGTERGDAGYPALWAGQGVGLYRDRPAAELVANLVSEAEEIVKRLAGD